MQPVAVPGPPVLDGLEGPEVEHRAVVAVRDGPHVPVVRRDLAPQVAEQRDAPGVEARGHHDGADGRLQVGKGPLEAFGHLVGVRAGPDDVVAARAEAHQVGSELLGPGHLVLDDLVEELAPDSEVGVAEGPLGPLICEQHREPVRPADERPVRAGVTDALRETVADRRVRPERAAAE